MWNPRVQAEERLGDPQIAMSVIVAYHSDIMSL